MTIPQTILKITNAKDENYVEWVPELPPNIQKVLPDVHFGSLGKSCWSLMIAFGQEMLTGSMG